MVTYDEQPLAFEFACVPEIMSVHHSSRELFHPRIIGDVRYRIMASGHHDIVEFLNRKLGLLLDILGEDIKIVGSFVVLHPSNHRLKPDEPSQSSLLPPP